MYNWEHESWPEFKYSEQIISDFALTFAEMTGIVTGILNTMDSELQQNEIIELMISEALKTSAIEGEMLSREDLLSSIRNKLGLGTNIRNIRDKRAENVALLMIQVRENYKEKLSEEMLKNWHKILFSGSDFVNAGNYREGTEPIQIISGSYSNVKIHYETPPSARVAKEMKQFVEWYNSFETNGNMQKIIVKTAITHLFFESIHPFEDGNGRIGRALIEKCLSESLNRPVTLSVSTAIENNRKLYYSELNKASYTLEINDWIVYFAQLLIEAQQGSINVINLSVQKTKFFDAYKDVLNKRQTKVLKKMIDNGADRFEGGMTTKKYVSITRASKATATRDLQELVNHHILIRQGEGRSTNYVLKW